MAKKVRATGTLKNGETVNVYGELTADNMVSVYTKHEMLGLYRVERFPGGVLTASSFREFFNLSK